MGRGCHPASIDNCDWENRIATIMVRERILMRKSQLKYPLVMIEWEDSQRPLAPWQWVDEFTLPDAVTCLSVGFLIAESESALAIAPNMGDLEQDRAQACGIIRIPASAVRSVKKIALNYPEVTAALGRRRRRDRRHGLKSRFD